MGGLGGNLGEVKGGDGGRLDMDDAVLDLELAGDTQRGLQIDDEAIRFELRRSHDAVGHTGFVFE